MRRRSQISPRSDLLSLLKPIGVDCPQLTSFHRLTFRPVVTASDGLGMKLAAKPLILYSHRGYGGKHWPVFVFNEPVFCDTW